MNFFVMNFSRQKKHQLHNGFSLLELIISLFVLSVGLIAVIGLVTASLRISFTNNYISVSAMLAQEGIELVHNIRDTNLAKGDDASFTGIDGDRRGSWRNSGEVVLEKSSEYVLKRDGNNIYTHSGGTPTQYSRKINISGSGNTRMVTSMVVWGGSATSFPPVSNCTVDTKCSFLQAILQK